MMSVIMLNCIVMAISNPKKSDDEQDPWIIGISTFFDVIYVLEVSLNLTAFGIVRYLMDPWHYVDLIVSAVSFIDIFVIILDLIVQFFGGPSITFNGAGSENLKLLRVVRVLRPLKAISFIPSLLVFIESIAQSAHEIGANMLLLIMVQFIFAAVGCAWIGDALSYRCVATDFNDPNLLTNPHYIAYGATYFTSKYNSKFCGAEGL